LNPPSITVQKVAAIGRFVDHSTLAVPNKSKSVLPADDIYSEYGYSWPDTSAARPDMPKQAQHDRPTKPPTDPITCVQSNVVKRFQAARARIQPRMLAAVRHFTKFVTLAKELPSHVPWDYNVKGFGALHTDESYCQEWCLPV